MRHVLVLRGAEGTKRAYQAHRQARRDAGLPPVTTDNFAYAAFVYVGDTEEEGRRVGSKLLWFLNTSLKSAPQHSRFMPGSAPPEAAPQVFRDAPRPPNGANGGGGPNLTNAEKGVTASANQNARRLMSLGVEEAMAMGILFVGNPDSVYRQITEFNDKVGGFNHSHDRPLRLHDAPREREGHPAVRAGGFAEVEGDQGGRGGVIQADGRYRIAAAQPRCQNRL